MGITQELTDLKEKIDEAKSDQDRLEGNKDQLIIQLKEKFKISSTEKAEKLLIKMKEDLAEMKEDLESGLDKFKEDYGEALDEY